MASDADVSLEKEYVVRSKKVFLSLTIGEGQFGTSDVFLDDDRVLRASGPLKVLLGNGCDIVGKTVIVRSVVNDVSSAAAFVLLDVAPASVERPDNPKSFALNLLNHLGASSGLPKDYAMEVAPYWLTFHPNLTFRQYQRPSPLQSLAQTFSVSIATAPLDEKTHADPGSRIGVGFRTQVWNGEPNAELEERVAELETINGTILDNLAQGLPIDEQRLEGTDKGAGNSGPGC